MRNIIAAIIIALAILAHAAIIEHDWSDAPVGGGRMPRPDATR